MERDMDSIDAILKSVADGAAVNWDAAIQGASFAEKQRVEDLRLVARIAEFHHDLAHRSEESGDSSHLAPMPEKWGELLILERIGSGAHADVLRAWDPMLQRDVALKLLQESRGQAESNAESSALVREGRALARVKHPHVVAVHGIDVRAGRVGLWMELVKGSSLEREVQAHGPLAPGQATRLGIEIGSALVAVHAAGLVHRDVKPANVVQDAGGRFVLADFGLGTRYDEPPLRAARPTGTPLYMAPELFAGAPPTPRTDAYALGLLLWYALAGRHAFDAETFAGLREMVARGAKPKLREIRSDLDVALAEIVERAAAPESKARFASASDLVEALRAVPGDALAAKRGAPGRGGASRWPIAAALAGIAALVAVVVLQSGREPGDTRREPSSPTTAPLPGAGVPVPAPPGSGAASGAIPQHAGPGATTEAPYAVEASFLLRRSGAAIRLVSGDPVVPGDRLSLEMRVTRPAWVYVLNEDDRGECYLLFPQPMFDVQNPLPADVERVLPGPIDGRENAWTVTSPGGREYFLVVVSPDPVQELEQDLARIPAPTADKPIEYAAVGDSSVEHLRGVGGIKELPPESASPPSRSRTFERFRALAGREEDVRGLWVRQVVLENPTK